jgi:hypothetical protein
VSTVAHVAVTDDGERIALTLESWEGPSSMTNSASWQATVELPLADARAFATELLVLVGRVARLTSSSDW